MKLQHLDLFSGIGGFSLGLEATGGFETKAFCDIEKYPRQVLQKHWPHVKQYEDIKELNYERLKADGIDQIDIITRLKVWRGGGVSTGRGEQRAHEEGWGEVQACAKGAAARRSAHVCALHRKALQFPHHPTRQRRTWTGAVGAQPKIRRRARMQAPAHRFARPRALRRHVCGAHHSHLPSR